MTAYKTAQNENYEDRSGGAETRSQNVCFQVVPRGSKGARRAAEERLVGFHTWCPEDQLFDVGHGHETSSKITPGKTMEQRPITATKWFSKRFPPIPWTILNPHWPCQSVEGSHAMPKLSPGSHPSQWQHLGGAQFHVQWEWWKTIEKEWNGRCQQRTGSGVVVERQLDIVLCKMMLFHGIPTCSSMVFQAYQPPSIPQKSEPRLLFEHGASLLHRAALDDATKHPTRQRLAPATGGFVAFAEAMAGSSPKTMSMKKKQGRDSVIDLEVIAILNKGFYWFYSKNDELNYLDIKPQSCRHCRPSKLKIFRWSFEGLKPGIGAFSATKRCRWTCSVARKICWAFRKLAWKSSARRG